MGGARAYVAEKSFCKRWGCMMGKISARMSGEVSGYYPARFHMLLGPRCIWWELMFDSSVRQEETGRPTWKGISTLKIFFH